MSENHRDIAGKVFNFLGGLSGLLSIALIIWKGGVLWQMVADHDRRITNVEQRGSIGLIEHVKLDDERVGAIKSEQAQDREIRQRLLESVNSVVSDVKVINTKLDAIKEQINKK